MEAFKSCPGILWIYVSCTAQEVKGIGILVPYKGLETRLCRSVQNFRHFLFKLVVYAAHTQNSPLNLLANVN